MGSVATMRRSRLRRRAAQRVVAKSLYMLADASSDISCLDTPFGTHVARTLLETETQKRVARDIFPLPLMYQLPAGWPPDTDDRCKDAIKHLVNMSVAGLNYLACGGKKALGASPGNKIQRYVLNSISKRWWHIAEHMSAERAAVSGERAYDVLVAKGRGGKCVPLVAEQVDLADVCGHVDPLPFLPARLAKQVRSPGHMFPQGVASLPSCPRFAGSRPEYIMLVRRQLRARKVRVATTCLHAAPVFAVPKKALGHQREVWNGSALCSITAAPPKMPQLANPASLSNLESSDDRPIWISARDAATWFDQLLLPEELRQYTGRPHVTIEELCAPNFKGARHPGQYPMSRDELLMFFDGNIADVSDTQKIWPITCCWPMGHSYSAAVAQHTLLASVHLAEQLLHDEHTLPRVDMEHLALALDDVNIFERGSLEDLSARPAATDRLDKVWDDLGIVRNHDKSVNRVSDQTALGMDIRWGRLLMPKRSKRVLMVRALQEIIVDPWTSPCDFASFVGSLTWVMLGNRPSLSVFSSVYNFIRNEFDTTVRKLPQGSIDELKLFYTLLFGLVVDLRDDWLNEVYACDGAQSYGYGGCHCVVTPEIARAAAAASSGIDDQIILRGVQGASKADRRKNGTSVLPARMHDFVTDFSIKSSKGFHSTRLEIGAAVLMLRTITRRSRRHGKRVLILTDSMAVRFGLRKGRSSAPNMAFGLRQAAAYAIASELKLHAAYVPTFSNPADLESRGHTRTHVCRRRKPTRVNLLVQDLHDLKRSVRHLRRAGMMRPIVGSPGLSSRWSSSCSDSLLGQTCDLE